MTGQSNYVSLLIVYDPVSLNLTVAMNFFFAIFRKTTRGELDFRRNRLAASSKQFLPKINKFSIFVFVPNDLYNILTSLNSKLFINIPNEIRKTSPTDILRNLQMHSETFNTHSITKPLVRLSALQ